MAMRAEFWEPLEAGKVRCTLCFRRCAISEGENGFCGVRFNEAGVLCTRVGDALISLHADPVEKKPLFHFLPGTRTLSMGTLGCNFSCLFCQNYSISRLPVERNNFSGMEKVDPCRIAELAQARREPSLSFTYNEPTVFIELMTRVADRALDLGLKTVMVSNGAMSEACLEALGPRITGCNIDLKCFKPETYARICGGSLKQVLRNLVRMRELGWWVEVTTLVVPGMNDTEKELSDIAGFIRDELGKDTPWHVSAFHPCFRMTDRPPTRASEVLRAVQAGLTCGLSYVYSGNIASREGSSTLCPACGTVCIERAGFSLVGQPHAACPKCGTAIPGVWQ